MEITPLSSLEALLLWDGPGELKEYLDTLPTLAPRSPPVGLGLSTQDNNFTSPEHRSRPTFRTLVCHDMKNGYLQDRFIYGSTDADAYRFYHWESIDTFVYFSHHLVTIPPCGWVHTAHRHGVKVLGTFITEWEDGAEFWERIFGNKIIFETVINKLVEIAHAYRFDGWLMNVETEIPPEKVPDLVSFTEELTRRTHDRLINSEVIWYDSVTKDGKLKWQNQLNDLNKCFFDVSDGIFLNYQWNDERLENSVEVAGSRFFDVYVGLDVFGRNFYEGGGFNSYKALKVIRKYNLSVAFFAQGWIQQALGAVDFFSNSTRFWGSMNELLLSYGPTKLPLQTSFCQGFGKNYFYEGVITEAGTWYDLSRQQIQPNWPQICWETPSVCSIDTDEAFAGGSCLTLWVDHMTTVKLMVCKIPLVPELQFEFAYKTAGAMKYLSFNFTFELDETEGEAKESELCLAAEYDEKNKEDMTQGTVIPHFKGELNGWNIRRYFVENRNGWMKCFKIRAEGPALIKFGQLSVKDLSKGEI